MPRLTTLKAEVGTTGDVVIFGLTESAKNDIAFAVQKEHWCQDEDCDIREALQAGFPVSAAHLLSGATETPLLDAVARHHEIDLSDFPADEWEDWETHHANWFADNNGEEA